ncbi:hypothetical protein SUGI_0450020 [Cryptomeria japonica]|nr:hypothetical protein SUGI_0450020 [Cryptomeria japonica]
MESRLHHTLHLAASCVPLMLLYWRQGLHVFKPISHQCFSAEELGGSARNTFVRGMAVSNTLGVYKSESSCIKIHGYFYNLRYPGHKFILYHEKLHLLL